MKNWFANLKFRYKLLLGMIAITTAALFMISQLSYSYFYRRNVKEVHTKAEYSVQMAMGTLSAQLTSLADAASHVLVQAPFPQMISDMNTGSFRGYSGYYAEAFSRTSTFLQNHILVSNLLLCGQDNIMFSPTILGNSQAIQRLFPDDLWSCSGISILPVRPNTLSQQGSVIPIVYPVSSKPGNTSSLISYQDQEGTAKARYVVLLDAAQIRTYFNQMSNTYTDTMYLADRNGNPLDITKQQYPVAFLPEVMAWAASASSYSQEQLPMGEEELFMAADSMKFCGLKVVHISKKSALTGDIRELRSFFTMIWFLCMLAAALLALALSHLLTRQIKTLADIIGCINRHDYEHQIRFSHSDEISLLGKQLNQMYDTIQLQVQQIQEEEQKKARTEIQMMSEQIKPHFLYNTLECIHFQMLNGHGNTAGGMLESLGRYLRITLSVGSPFITLEKETEHVTSYMEIMNRRSSRGIGFQCQLDPVLRTYQIMKIILQPLAENCMKHGFEGGLTGREPVPPQIRIAISLQNHQFIQIEVTDNGKGFDITKAQICCQTGEVDGTGHFGLHNIYKRLKTCYGNQADMTFISIPYFKNTVTVVIPYEY